MQVVFGILASALVPGRLHLAGPHIHPTIAGMGMIPSRVSVLKGSLDSSLQQTLALQLAIAKEVSGQDRIVSTGRSLNSGPGTIDFLQPTASTLA